MAEMFALRDSSYNSFLHANVGIEANGCGLTILSVLARLGKDPWAEAAVWSHKPKDAAVDALTQDIDLMELRQPPDGSARATALRLIDLLPRSPRSANASVGAGTEAADRAMPNGTKLAIWFVCIYFALTIGMSFLLGPDAATVAPPPPATALTNK